MELDKKTEKRHISILVIVGFSILISFALSGFLGALSTTYSILKERKEDSIKRMESFQQIIEITIGDAKEMYFDFWKEHYDEIHFFLPQESDADIVEKWRDDHNEATRRIVLENDPPSVAELEGMDEETRREFAEFAYNSINTSLFLSKNISDVMNITMFEYLGDSSIFIYATTLINDGTVSRLGDQEKISPEKDRVVSEYMEKGEFKTKTYILKSPENGRKNLYVLVPIVENGKLLCLIGGDFPWADFRDSALDGLLRYEANAIIFRIATILFLVILLYLTVVKPVKTMQSEIREYMGSKKSEDVVKGLQDLSRRGDEIGGLANDMTALSLEIDDYCEKISLYAKKKATMDAELNVATKIQADALPKDFPERKEFDLYASMNPALEVGGDFYDFFMIDDDHLALVIADVSDKGIPAALFMMLTKTMIEAFSTTAGSIIHPTELFNKVNDRLNQNNELSMFTTAWMGILTISTGEIKGVNAGHEFPAVLRKGDNDNPVFELHKAIHSLPLALYPGIEYKAEDLCLKKGDALFVYTDGVTEAASPEGELFGEERLVSALNRCVDMSAKETIESVRESIETFVGDNDQFDDITMMCFKYFGPEG